MRRSLLLQPSATVDGVWTIDGDSITTGAGLASPSTECWPAIAAPLTGGAWTQYNLAVIGQTLADMVTNFSDVSTKPVAFARWSKGKRPGNVLVEMGGRNSWISGDPWTHFLKWAEYVALARAAGYDTIITVENIPSGATVEVNGKRLLYHAYKVRSGLADLVIETSSIAESQDTTDTDYYQDGTHPTAALAALIGQAVAAQLDAFTGIDP